MNTNRTPVFSGSCLRLQRYRMKLSWGRGKRSDFTEQVDLPEALKMTDTIESRIQSNKHFGSILRRRLENRHGESTAVRKTLELLSDDELISRYIQHNRQGREHVMKQRAKEG